MLGAVVFIACFLH